MLTFTLPVVNRNCFLISVAIWCMGYYLLAWILFVMVAAVEYDEVKSLYSNYEEYYADRMEQERGKTTEDVSADAHILEEQIRLYTEQNGAFAQMMEGDGERIKENSYNYHETENADLDNDSSGPRTQYTETEVFWTEMIYKDWYHPTGIVMPEAIHYDVHSVCMYHSYYTYKSGQVELDLLTTSITLPAKVMGCEPFAQQVTASGGTHNVTIQTHLCNIHAYASGYTQHPAYIKASVPPVAGTRVFTHVWI